MIGHRRSATERRLATASSSSSRLIRLGACNETKTNSRQSNRYREPSRGDSSGWRRAESSTASIEVLPRTIASPCSKFPYASDPVENPIARIRKPHIFELICKDRNCRRKALLVQTGKYD